MGKGTSFSFFRNLARSGSRWGNRFALFLMAAAVFCGFATYAALTEAPLFASDPGTVIGLLNLDLVVLLLLSILIARRIVKLRAGQREGEAGSRLHARLVLVFGLLVATPAVLMTVFAAFFLYFGVQSWFGERIGTAVSKSQAVAEAYLAEHQQVIRADILGMANDLNRQAAILLENPEAFEKVMRTQAYLRNFSESIVFDAEGHVLAHANLSGPTAFETLPAYDFVRATAGDIVLMTGENDDRVRALVRLEGFPDAYLVVGRAVDPVVLSYVTETHEAAAAYEALENQRSNLQIKITLVFVVVALLLLLAAVWFALIVARQLVTPIGELVTAADRVRSGDLTARVREFKRNDEFTVLARAFNRMTGQLQTQRNELIEANRQLDQRRRFTETVLAGVSAGIVGVDEQGIVRLVNGAACDLFVTSAEHLTGQTVFAALPGLAALLETAHSRPDKITQAEMPFQRPDGQKRTLLVRIAIEMIGQEDKGAVLTFDDITELQSAQRKAAWADVARRIAHEIKNPLTPIQLSAERLKRKYLRQITEDSDVFSQCTDTIIHHVEDIGRMVNEFSAFARMPDPAIRPENLSRHILEVLVLEQQAHPDIRFVKTGFGPGIADVTALFDSRQLRQALTNIVQNAIDSIHMRIEAQKQSGSTPADGRIEIRVAPDSAAETVTLSVADNGIGLPKSEDIATLTEPYVTHKPKGTGLGLAIVKKVMDDHHGRLILAPGPEGGATVSLVLPMKEEMKKAG